MTDTLAFLLAKSLEHLEKGLQGQRGGSLAQARQDFLKAAEFLFKAAAKSPPPLKEKRLQRAEALLKRAETLGREMAVTASAPQLAEEAGVPSSLWEVAERPAVRLADVAGLEEAKEQIRIKMIYPFTHPELAQKFGIKKGGGILLFGPPGTGKTLLARAVAGEIDAAFFTVKPSEIMSKWVGEAEQNVARLFAAARSHQRAVIFIDEVEALVPKRAQSGSTVMQRVVPQILSEMDGFASGKEAEGKALLFLGATNEPWLLDEAMLRPGRLDEKIYIPLPDLEARRDILAMNLKGKPLASDVVLDDLARRLEGYSGADIRRICEKAGDIPFVESIKTGEERECIELRDILTAMQQVRPSVSARLLERYERFAREGAV